MEIKINMNNEIEIEVFKKANFNFQKLEKYGFKKDNDIYKLVKTILNDKFKIIIEIDKNGTIIGKVLDIKTNDEYSNFRGNTLGDFSSKVKSEYLAILNDIKSKCSDITYFSENQANRVCNYIIDKFKIIVQKFITWVCHKFSYPSEDDLIRNFEKETYTNFNIDKQLDVSKYEKKEKEDELELY